MPSQDEVLSYLMYPDVFLKFAKARDYLLRLDEEVTFLESIARQLAIGYQYTSLYVAQEQETRRTNALREIANTLNARPFDSVEALLGEVDAVTAAVTAASDPKRRRNWRSTSEVASLM